jgi:hypothetical protein
MNQSFSFLNNSNSGEQRTPTKSLFTGDSDDNTGEFMYVFAYSISDILINKIDSLLNH